VKSLESAVKTQRVRANSPRDRAWQSGLRAGAATIAAGLLLLADAPSIALLAMTIGGAWLGVGIAEASDR